MKIAVSSEGKDLDSNVDPRFGRAKYFIIYDTETDEYSAVDNEQNLQAAQGAGIQAAQNVVGYKVEVAVSGNFGPKAFRTLSAAGIKAATWSEGSIREAVKMVKENRLKFADSANVEGHWS